MAVRKQNFEEKAFKSEQKKQFKTRTKETLSGGSGKRQF